MKKINNYNSIAIFYDKIAGALLGKGYSHSKKIFLEEISPGQIVLFLGGGTGENLVDLLQRVGPSGKIYYIESSSTMIQLALRKIPDPLMHRLVTIREEDFDKIPIINFQIVITQYFLDVLTEEQLHLLFQAINQRKASHAKWIFVDFFPAKHKRIFLFFMIHTFRLLVRHPRACLPDFDYFFNHYGWNVIKTYSMREGFIQAKLFRPDS